jgi:hypothetical protein
MTVSSFYDWVVSNTVQLAWIYKEDFTLNKTCAVLLRARHAQFEGFLHGKTSWVDVTPLTP